MLMRRGAICIIHHAMAHPGRRSVAFGRSDEPALSAHKLEQYGVSPNYPDPTPFLITPKTLLIAIPSGNSITPNNLYQITVKDRGGSGSGSQDEARRVTLRESGAKPIIISLS